MYALCSWCRPTLGIASDSQSCEEVLAQQRALEHLQVQEMNLQWEADSKLSKLRQTSLKGMSHTCSIPYPSRFEILLIRENTHELLGGKN